MSKKYSIILILAIIFLINLVNAAQNCDNNQTIMKLSGENNSHGALWNDVSYTTKICYNVIYGKNFIGANPHECSNNKVVGLAGTSNAHAEIPERSSYTTNVCFGDLICRSIDTSSSTDNCNGINEKIVVSLAQKSNSHLAEGNNINYPIKICCKLGIEVQQAYWTDMQELPISNADLNDLVKLIATGAGLENKEITYKIFKVNTGLWFTDRKIADTSNKGVLEWRAGKNDNGSLSAGNYYFNASVEGKEVASGNLVVLANEINTPPIANITNPKNKQIYFLGEKLNFTQNSSDKDDRFSFVWNFGDGVTLTGNSSNLSSFKYSYSEAGQKNIILIVTDNRGELSVDRISILIVNSSYILTYIDKPEFGFTYGRTFDFDASSSYAVEAETINGCEKRITCLAGKCPQQTAGCPPCYASNNLTCPISVIGTPKNYDAFNFLWVFKRGEIDAGQKSAVGDAGVAFTHTFPAIGFYVVELTINILSSSVSSKTNTEFRVSFSNPTCFLVNDETDKKFIPGSSIGDSYWVSESSLVNSNENCYDPIGIDRNGEPKLECCPSGYSCDIDSSRCIFNQIDSCQSFKNESSCIDDDGHDQIAFDELDNLINQDPIFPGGCNYADLYGESCTQFVSCKCDWNPTNNTCQAVSKHKIKTLDLSRTWDFDDNSSEINNLCLSSSEPQVIGKCVFDFTYTGNCLEGDEFIGRSWTAVYESSAASENIPDYCKDGSDTISCEKTVRLPFFSFFNLIAVILILMIFYYLKIKNIKIIKLITLR